MKQEATDHEPGRNTALQIWGSMTILSLLPMLYLGTRIVAIVLQHRTMLEAGVLDLSPDEKAAAIWFFCLIAHWQVRKLLFSIRIAPEALGFEIVPRAWL